MFEFDKTDKPLEKLAPLQRLVIEALRTDIIEQLQTVRPRSDPKPVVAVVDPDGAAHVHRITIDLRGGLHQSPYGQTEVLRWISYYLKPKAAGFMSCAWMIAKPLEKRNTIPASFEFDPDRVEIAQASVSTLTNPAMMVLFELNRKPAQPPTLGGMSVNSGAQGFVPDMLTFSLKELQKMKA